MRLGNFLEHKDSLTLRVEKSPPLAIRKPAKSSRQHHNGTRCVRPFVTYSIQGGGLLDQSNPHVLKDHRLSDVNNCLFIASTGVVLSERLQFLLLFLGCILGKSNGRMYLSD